MLFLAVIFVPVAGALSSRPFQPHPSLAPLRAVVIGMAVIAIGLFLLSLGPDWWVIEDWEREETIVDDASSSALALLIVVAGLLSGVLTVTAARGHRNWAPVPLTVGWLLVGLGWYASTGEFRDSDAGGEARLALKLATWSMVLVTITAVVGSVGRLLERRAARGVGRPADAG